MDDGFDSLIIKSLCVIVISVTLIICVFVYFDNKNFIEAGYTHAMLPGRSSAAWVKP